MGARILIVDYGVGNLYSVHRAVEVSGGEGIVISDRADEIAAAERVILPGVGAFADGMAGLRERGLVAPIVAHARAGKPLLGICLGMQMLASASEEFGHHAGLDLIPGEVKPIPRQGSNSKPIAIIPAVISSSVAGRPLMCGWLVTMCLPSLSSHIP